MSIAPRKFGWRLLLLPIVISAKAPIAMGQTDLPMSNVAESLRSTGEVSTLSQELAQGLGFGSGNLTVMRKVLLSDDGVTHMMAVDGVGSRIVLAQNVSSQTMVFWVTSPSGAIERTLRRDVGSLVIAVAPNEVYRSEFKSEWDYWAAHGQASVTGSIGR